MNMDEMLVYNSIKSIDSTLERKRNEVETLERKYRSLQSCISDSSDRMRINILEELFRLDESIFYLCLLRKKYVEKEGVSA